MGLFFYTKKGSIISTVDLPTTEIIEPKNLENYMTDVSKYAIIITNIKRLHYKNDKLEALSVSIFEIEK
ncbi:hypothetical protein Si128_00095 [Streptococcus infantarius subsp. infantarius]|nr:hypothetical protein [Streptococcus infantarius subsp. infantarius]